MACRYCDTKSNTELFSDESRDIAIGKYKTMTFFDIDRQSSRNTIEIDINYCPMCGRKL